jgi:hypothetical protein
MRSIRTKAVIAADAFVWQSSAHSGRSRFIL